VFDISELGLVEMTRKRIGEGLLTEFSEICPNCEGRGVVIDHSAAGLIGRFVRARWSGSIAR
jgi:Ribonuclease G/E